MKIDLLDKGFVEHLGTFGDELTIVNAARVSFGAESKEFQDRDARLMRYLYKHKHFSPFRHVILRLRLKAPEFVMRQAYKHVVGIEVTAASSCKDHAWNEISGRYKPVNEYYYPSTWRRQHPSSKQASAGPVPEDAQELAQEQMTRAMQATTDAYQKLLELGVAKEQARIILPMNQYTETIWTCSAQALINFIELRAHPEAQEEIRVYAEAICSILYHSLPTLMGMLEEIR